MKPGPLLKKLKTLTFLPLIVIALGFFYFAFESFHTLVQTQQLETRTEVIKQTAKLINEIQRERGLSIGFLASDGKEFAAKLQTQRRKVDLVLQNLLPLFAERHEPPHGIFRHIRAIREKVDTKLIAPSDTFGIYSDIVRELIHSFLQMKKEVADPYAKNLYDTYTNLVFMKESLGRIRGAFNGIFSKRQRDHELLIRIVRARGIYDNALFRFDATAPDDARKRLERLLASPDYLWYEDQYTRYMTLPQEAGETDPALWWQRMTRIIDGLYGIERLFFAKIDRFVDQKSLTIRTQILFQGLLLLLFTLFIAWLSYRLKEEILKNIRLLDEYKEAVDQGTIVSKTDRRGIITYANDRFCDISGFRCEELLGRPHNIVRHPDVPKEVFKEMWETIRNKQTWHGIIKNRKKDGGVYIVEATIKPILDHNGEIEEYIAIRHDITQVFQLKEELETTQRDLLFKLGEIAEARSLETGFHVQRVAEYTKLLGRFAGLGEEELEYLYLASSMHDIGKIAIPDAILHKRGTLSDEEWETMKRHTFIGHALFKDSDKPLFHIAAIVTLEHHENYDGTGYPYGKKGEAIHLYGRITALADVFDALATDRCYKKAWPMEKVLAYIKEQRGKKFDPALVDILFENLEEFLKIRERLAG